MKPVLLSLALLLAAVPVSAAVTYTYQFTGSIDTIGQNQNNAIPGVYVGQSFSGWFSYNSDSLTTEIGALSFTLGSFQPAVIDDRLYCSVVTAFELTTRYYDTQGQYEFWRTGVTLRDTTGNTFTNAQLPTNIVFSMLTSARFEIYGSKGTDGFNLSGPITSLSAIPEPATLLLLACGAVRLRPKKQK